MAPAGLNRYKPCVYFIVLLYYQELLAAAPSGVLRQPANPSKCNSRHCFHYTNVLLISSPLCRIHQIAANHLYDAWFRFFAVNDLLPEIFPGKAKKLRNLAYLKAIFFQIGLFCTNFSLNNFKRNFLTLVFPVRIF